jgi:6,7-dimethyl-8-ribityllumazine synthase
MISKETSVEGFRVALVVSKYNDFITARLLEGALEALRSRGISEGNISIFQVPGSFEIPQVARKIAERKEFDAIICIGAVLRGETLHFELISEQCAAGIQKVATDFGVPVTFGVITADNEEQAIARSGSKSENKGWEAAVAAMEMAELYRKLGWSQEPS